MSDSGKQPPLCGDNGGTHGGDARHYLASPSHSPASGCKHSSPPQDGHALPAIVVAAADCSPQQAAALPPPPPFGMVAVPGAGQTPNQYLSPSAPGAGAPVRGDANHNASSASEADHGREEDVYTQEDIARMIEKDPHKRIAVVHGTVFDVTNFAPYHPGGASVFVTGNGKDVSSTFDAMHSARAKAKLMNWAIGKFAKERPREKEAAVAHDSSKSSERMQRGGGSGDRGAEASKTFSPRLASSAQHSAGDDGASAPGKGDSGSSDEMVMADIRARIAENPGSIILILFGDVYDVTSFAEKHPGGVRVLASSNGRECGETFMRIHGLRARDMVKKYYIGHLKDSSHTVSPLRATPGAGMNSATPVSIFRQRASSTRLLQVEQLGSCSTVRYFTFSCPFPMSVPPGGHIKIYSDVDKGNGRFYTPYKTELASFSLCVKHYPDGVTSSYLFNLKEGAEVFYEGPFAPAWMPHMDPYLNDARIANTEKHLLLLAGGTGISPLYTLAKDALQRQAAHVTLLLSVNNREQLLLSEELAALEGRFSRAGECCFTVFVAFSQSFSSADAEASGANIERSGLRLSRQNTLYGKIDTNMLRRVPLPKSTQAVAICGPPPFNNALSRCVVEAGICGEKRVHVFE